MRKRLPSYRSHPFIGHKMGDVVVAVAVAVRLCGCAAATGKNIVIPIWGSDVIAGDRD
jgi:hypothetical protein